MKTYMESSLGEEEKKEKIREMLDTGWEIVRSIPNEPVYQCCVNTELNNTNFLVDEKGYTYLVDWEKPLYARSGAGPRTFSGTDNDILEDGCAVRKRGDVRFPRYIY